MERPPLSGGLATRRGRGQDPRAVLDARDLGKLKTWIQSVAAIGGLAAAGAVDDAAAWGVPPLAALVITWLSGLDYARVAPSLLRRRAPA
jgi:phosphatidylglycerophosphate synthase